MLLNAVMSLELNLRPLSSSLTKILFSGIITTKGSHSVTLRVYEALAIFSRFQEIISASL